MSEKSLVCCPQLARRPDTSALFCDTELRQRLEASPAIKQDHAEFLAYMSHELRTPLTAIIGFTQVLKMAEDVPTFHAKRDEYVHGIDQSAQHLLRMTQAMLSYLERVCEVEATRPEKLSFAGAYQ